mgnify:FL=1|tara:strand:+ start:247 stop:735 length:489 start_codon:yes stop_codon:yes gene_type:complete
MTRKEILDKIKESGYFIIQELVGKEVYEKHGDNSWFVLSTELLETIYFIRHKKGQSMTVNTWHRGGRFKERGHRANIQHIVKSKTDKDILYTSAHPLGMGIDFTFKEEKAEDTRNWLLSIKDELPHKIRLEHRYASTGIPITWVHLDTKYFEQNPKVYLFNV